ncbi:MAG: triphosphoribosyl-dephospho-CoA synthase [Gemmataceae bacterium]|nr:triphosphoribosyl-dephospho-CoA synthase [Gemmataceae bacterium]
MKKFPPSLTWYDYEGTMIEAHTACVWEATSRKVGNVHPGASFEDLDYLTFIQCAGAILASLGHAPRSDLGTTIRLAVAETQWVRETNCNLGIILLLAPLASTWSSPAVHRAQVADLLAKTTVKDTKRVYEAIRLANPGGLGDAPEQDVRNEPTVTLLEAMKLAADRDMVARQYANGFADCFDFGVPAFTAAFAKFGCVEAAIIDSQLQWLATYPDSLIARKNGLAVAEDVQRRAQEVLAIGGIETPQGRAAGVALDKHLRSDGNKLNPGTTADLITACLFVALRENKVSPSAPFRWDVTDWL